MLPGFSGGPFSYSGNDTHRYIEKLLDSRGDILIVSPYIDAYYARAMLRRHRRGRFYVISSSIEDSAKSMLNSKPNRTFLPAGILAFLFLLILPLHYGLSGIYLVPSAIPLGLGIAKGRKRANVVLKRPSEFIHAKMYISDTMAIVGSVNLTYKGTHKNVEQISILHSARDIGQLKDQFWAMWDKF